MQQRRRVVVGAVHDDERGGLGRRAAHGGAAAQRQVVLAARAAAAVRDKVGVAARVDVEVLVERGGDDGGGVRVRVPHVRQLVEREQRRHEAVGDELEVVKHGLGRRRRLARLVVVARRARRAAHDQARVHFGEDVGQVQRKEVRLVRHHLRHAHVARVVVRQVPAAAARGAGRDGG